MIIAPMPEARARSLPYYHLFEARAGARTMKRSPKGKHRNPLRLPVAESPRTWFVTFDAADKDGTHVTVHDHLVGRDEVRADELQMFVNRLEEDYLLVVSFHFPIVRGRSRQLKCTVPLTHLLRSDAHVRTFEDGPIVEQAIVDLEQLVMNFMPFAFDALRQCAYLLATNNQAPTPPTPDDAIQPSDSDVRPEFVVNVGGRSWPLRRPRYQQFDVVRLDAASARRDVDAGYLIPASDIESDSSPYGQEYRDALINYRSRAAAERRAAQYRPKPTPIDEFLRTSAGAAVQQQLRNAFSSFADRIFPVSPGPKLERTAAAKAALADELRQKLGLELAAQVGRGERVSKEAAYEKMATDTHGQPPKALGVSAIKNLIGRDIKPTRHAERKRLKRKPHS